MGELRQHRERTLATLRETLRIARKVRDTARQEGREAFARHEDRAIANLEGRIDRIEGRGAEVERRLAQRGQGGMRDPPAE